MFQDHLCLDQPVEVGEEEEVIIHTVKSLLCIL